MNIQATALEFKTMSRNMNTDFICFFTFRVKLLLETMDWIKGYITNTVAG